VLALCAAELGATHLTQRERGCCERGTLMAHALVLGRRALTLLYVPSASAKAKPTLAVVAILMEPPELDLKSPSDHMPQCSSQSNDSQMVPA
jgi:hypothetical protein